MNTYERLTKVAMNLIDEDSSYQLKPTKAASARLRKHIGEIQKLAVEAKRDLIKADKGE